MPEFLRLQSLAQAKSLFWQNLPPISLKVEKLDTRQALGRVLAHDVTSPEESPAFNRSTVDGYAVRAADTFGASDALPAYLRLAGGVTMGRETTLRLTGGEAALIHTGGMLPEGCDAVVMLEMTSTLSTGDIEIYKGVAPNENVVLKGEDVRIGEVIFQRGRRVRAEEIAALLALGINRVNVFSQPRVSIFSSGDEVIPPERTPNGGQVRDINSYALEALVKQHGGLPSTYPIVPDDPRQLERAIREVFADSDLVIVTAGSSASERDMTAEVISRFGQPGVLVHGINVRPGKPTILAVCNGKPMIGLPGNPVSTLVIAHLFVTPLLQTLGGESDPLPPPAIQATLAVNLPSTAGRDDFIPVRLLPQNDQWLADPVFFKSSLIFTLAKADGLLHIPSQVTGYSAGDEVEVLLL